ncbi:MAG: DNA polymerase III subunit [Phycisphaerae bacterium]|nr:DNA polymerase III subunit [Phycisphaerae bacterium]
MAILDIYGQNRGILQLERARAASRQPHSYIFHGPEGIGKAMLAMQWAGLQLCSEPKVANLAGLDGAEGLAGLDQEILDSCGHCESCHLVASGNHPDIHFIDRELAKYTKKTHKGQLLTLPIDVIREFVIDVSANSAVFGGSKIFIIDNAETMNWQTQNALLKTLEEPPENTFIILVTARPDKLLTTIHSRCQMVRFYPISIEYVGNFLQNQHLEMDSQQCRYWASFSNGQLGLALELAEMDLYAVKCELIEHLVKLDYSNALAFAGWIIDQAKAFSKSYVDLHSGFSASAATRRGYSVFLAMISQAFCESIRHSAGLSSIDQEREIELLAGRFGPTEAEKAIRRVAETENRLNANANASLTFESLLLDCIGYR